MRKTEKRIRQVEEEWVIETRCDLCGKMAGGNDYGSDTWEIEISYKHGSAWPECGDQTTESYDVCRACWRDKVLPLFNSAPPNVTRHEW